MITPHFVRVMHVATFLQAVLLLGGVRLAFAAFHFPIATALEGRGREGREGERETGRGGKESVQIVRSSSRQGTTTAV